MASVTREMHQATLKSMWSPSAVSQPAPVETSSAPLEGLLSGTTMKRVTNSGTTTANPVPTAPLLARDAQPREAQQKDEGEEQLQQLHNTAATKTNSESSPTGLTPLQPTAAAAQKMLGGEHALASGPITPVRRNEARAASAVSERGQQQQAKRDGKAPKMTNSELKKKTAAAAAATTAGAHAGGAVDGYAGPAVEAQAKLQLVPGPKAATKSKAAGSESTTIAGKRTARKATTAKTPAKTKTKTKAKTKTKTKTKKRTQPQPQPQPQSQPQPQPARAQALMQARKPKATTAAAATSTAAAIAAATSTATTTAAASSTTSTARGKKRTRAQTDDSQTAQSIHGAAAGVAGVADGGVAVDPDQADEQEQEDLPSRSTPAQKRARRKARAEQLAQWRARTTKNARSARMRRRLEPDADAVAATLADGGKKKILHVSFGLSEISFY
eukprot:gene8817-1894_t